jgi:Nitrile hydratase, alpha chain/Nitrile hydratase beta subunit
MSSGQARFAPGDRVRTDAVDPDHHTRLPRYARGHIGVIVETSGTWPLADDRAVLQEFGLRLPDDVTITVWDAGAKSCYLVLPLCPAGTEDLLEEDLATLVTGEGLIGTAAL